MRWSAAPRCGPGEGRPPHGNAATWRTPRPPRSTLLLLLPPRPVLPRRRRRRFRRRRHHRRTPLLFPLLQGWGRGRGWGMGVCGGAPFPRRRLLTYACWTLPCRSSPLRLGNRWVCMYVCLSVCLFVRSVCRRAVAFVFVIERRKMMLSAGLTRLRCTIYCSGVDSSQLLACEDAIIWFQSRAS